MINWCSVLTLTNYSNEEITHVSVLIDTTHARRRGSNRVFEAATHLVPGATRTVEARLVDNIPYDFKNPANARAGCELEGVVFADGTTWEEPSAL